MSFRPTRAPLHLPRTLLGLALALALAACGGVAAHDDSTGTSSASPAAQALSVAVAHDADVVHVAYAAAPAFVTVGGCVLDRHYIPTTGTPVRALAADGRLLGNAQSDGQGRFALRLPAHSDVTLQIDRPSGESLPMRVDAAASTSDRCLLDDQA